MESASASAHEVSNGNTTIILNLSNYQVKSYERRSVAPEMLTSGKQGLATLGLWAINDPRGA
jgi:hypothetical protein